MCAPNVQDREKAGDVVCTQCGKSFVDKEGLSNHLKKGESLEGGAFVERLLSGDRDTIRFDIESAFDFSRTYLSE